MKPLSRILNPGIVSVPIGISSGIFVTLFFTSYHNYKSDLAIVLLLIAIIGFVSLISLFYKISTQFENDLKLKESGMHRNDLWRKAEVKVLKKSWFYKFICFASILLFLISVVCTFLWKSDYQAYIQKKETEYIKSHESLNEIKGLLLNQNFKIDSSNKSIQYTLNGIFKQIEKQNYILNELKDSLAIINNKK